MTERSAESNGAWPPAQLNDDRKLAIIWPLLGRHIAFHRRLVDLTASVKAALLLSQTIYWTRHGRDIASYDGWFFKTSRQWEMETGLTVKEQATARQVLRHLAILNEQRIGIPAKLHFQLAADQLAALISERIGRGSSRLDWSDGAAVAELLGPALAYHRALAGIAGGVNAGLLLSRALHLTRIHAKSRPDGWVSRSMAHWTQELGLTRREQETARRALARIGVWEERIAGIPPRIMHRIRLGALLPLLMARANGEQACRTNILAPRFPDCGLPTNSDAPNGESSLRESHILVSPKKPNQFCRNRHDSFSESANSYVQRSTRTSVQPLHAPEECVEPAALHCGGDLILPEKLSPEERAAALLLVQSCAHLAQALLDELCARLETHAVHTSPIAYLRGMVRRAQAGAFVPELGLRIAAARRRRQEEIVLREQHEADARRLAAESATPEHQEKVAARKAQIRNMLEAMRSGRGAKP